MSDGAPTPPHDAPDSGAITAETLALAETERQAVEHGGGGAAVASRRLCTIQVGAAWVSMDADCVEEVCKLAEQVSVVPGAPRYVPGLMVLRGRPLPLLELADFLELARSTEEDLERRVVIVRAAGMRVGCVCDRVAGIERVPESALASPNAVQGARLAPHVVHTFDRAGAIAVLVDIASLLTAAKAS